MIKVGKKDFINNFNLLIMKRITYIFYFLLVMTTGVFGQKFEESVDEAVNQGKPEVQVGGDFALQFQFLNIMPTLHLFLLVTE